MHGMIHKRHIMSLGADMISPSQANRIHAMKHDSLESRLCDLIPEQPLSITTPQLLERLSLDASNPREHKRSMKTVQRALSRIEDSTQGLICDTSKPNRWSWRQGAKRLVQTRVDSTAALALILLRRHLDSLIPEPYRADLEPLFVKARDLARLNPDLRIARWEARTVTVPSSFTLQSPVVREEILREVQTALLERRQLDIEYRKPNENAPRSRRVHPQGLALCDGAFYLFAATDSREDPITFAVHRIEHASVSAQSSRDLPGFDAARHVAEGGLQFLTGKTIRLRLRVSSYLAVVLGERPLSDEQTIRQIDEDWSEVKATITESEQIEWWLCSWTDQCEVLAPAHLRRRMTEHAQGMQQLYANTPSRGGSSHRVSKPQTKKVKT